MAEIFAKFKVIEEETNIVAEAAQAKMDAAQKELAAAIPAMEAAEAAADCLTVRNVIEFSSYNRPPPGTELVGKAVMILKGITNESQLNDWNSHQMMFYQPHPFIESLKYFNKDGITPEQKAALKTPDILLNPVFNFDSLYRISIAAAHLANWVINIIRYNDIIQIVREFQKEQAKKQPRSDEQPRSDDSVIDSDDSMLDSEIFLISNNVKMDWVREQFDESINSYHINI